MNSNWNSWLLPRTLIAATFAMVCSPITLRCDAANSIPPNRLPDNLTQVEYLNLAAQYEDEQHFRLARDAAERAIKMGPKTKVGISTRHMVNTEFPLVTPSEDAEKLNLRARATRDIKLAKECVAKYPQYECGYMTMEYIDLNENRNVDMIQDCRAVLKINPHRLDALHNLAAGLMCAHRFDEAKLVYQNILKFEPNDVVAKQNLAQMPAYEAQASPFQQVANFFKLAMLPFAVAQRDSEAKKTSGYIDKSGKFLYHRLFTTNFPQYHDGVAQMSNCFVDKSGKIIGPNYFRQADNFSEGLAAISEKSEWGYINTSGAYAIPARFQCAKGFCEGMAPAKKDDSWGFIDKKGVWIVQPQFSDALVFSEGLSAVVKNGKVGYVDHSGKFAIKPQWDFASSFSDGVAVVSRLEVGGKAMHQYCIDKGGKVLFDLSEVRRKLDKQGELPNERKFLCSDEIAAVDDRDAYKMTGPVEPTQQWRFREGLMLVSSQGGTGFLDKQGHVVIPCQYVDATSFKDGIACVAVSRHEGKSDRAYGYIDKSAKFLVQPRFERAEQFSESLAAVKCFDGTGGYIDRTGKIVIPIADGACASFHDGAASVGSIVYYP